MSAIALPEQLYRALRQVIPNLPSLETGHVVSAQINIQARGFPEITIVQHAVTGDPPRLVVEDKGIKSVEQRFIIVALDPEDDDLDRWEKIEKARIRQKAKDALESLGCLP